MSDLQISLLVLGAVVVVSVLIYNQWQQKTLQKKLTESFGGSRRDVERAVMLNCWLALSRNSMLRLPRIQQWKAEVWVRRTSTTPLTAWRC
jgi:hypothetical protein